MRPIRGYKAHVIRDQLRFLCNAARLRLPAFMVIQRIDMCTPGEQILGTAVALVAMCEGASININDVMANAQNVIGDAAGPFTSHVQAVRAYAQGELARGDSVRGF